MLGLLIGAVLHPETGSEGAAPVDHAILLGASPSGGQSPAGEHDAHLNHPQAASVTTRSGGETAQLAVEPIPPAASAVPVRSPVSTAAPVRPADQAGRRHLLDLGVLRI